jgi:diguanylate cyclase
MSALSLDNIRDETRLVARVTSRDVAKRIGALALILCVCALAGERWSILPIAALALLSEVSAAFITRAMPPEGRDPSIRLMVAMWITNIPSTIVFLSPALLLVGSEEIPLVMAGFMWVFGIYVHLSNTFVAMPFYNWSQMVAAFGTGLGVVVVAGLHHGLLDRPFLWVVMLGLCVVYGSNTVATLALQKEFHEDLAAARHEARARLAALEHLARHDPLTGLLNRQAFDAALASLLTRGGVAVLLIDLDGFKPINDTYSHAAGDAVLQAVSRRLNGLVDCSGLVARLGGDEFALAVPDLVDGAEALALATRAAEAIEAPIEHGEKALRIGASVGVAIVDRPGRLSGLPQERVAAICGWADQAMYRAKVAARAGDPGPVLFDAAAFPPRPTLEDRRHLAEALAARRIRPAYQPVVDLSDGALIGFEALARWHHPTRGRLAPASFLPLITEFGLQGDFLTSMAAQVFADIEALVSEGLDPGRVSLNIPEIALATHSGRQDIDRLLDAHPNIIGHVVFEITEDVFIARAADMIRDSVAHFRKKGVGISLDDFGTGFASFHHLRHLEIDELKIDGSLVGDLGRDPAAEVLAGGFATIGAGLGARLIAEGVETEGQRRHLLRLGCRLGQGYLFGHARPFDETRLRLLAGEAQPGRSSDRPSFGPMERPSGRRVSRPRNRAGA